jgi:hypothetical protein
MLHVVAQLHTCTKRSTSLSHSQSIVRFVFRWVSSRNDGHIGASLNDKLGSFFQDLPSHRSHFLAQEARFTSWSLEYF